MRVQAETPPKRGALPFLARSKLTPPLTLLDKTSTPKYQGDEASMSIFTAT
jgi:hypothetical protein